MTETQGDGSGNTLSPEPPAPRCSWHLRQAVTVTVCDSFSTLRAESRRAIVCPISLSSPIGTLGAIFPKLPGRLR